MSIDRRWNRNEVSLESPDKEVNRRPTSLKKFRADASFRCYVTDDEHIEIMAGISQTPEDPVLRAVSFLVVI